MAERHARHGTLPVVGWREWVALPDLGVEAIKVKIDTGARTSSLHAYDLESFQRRGEGWVRFVVHPIQRDTSRTVVCEAKLEGQRLVRNTSGHQELRPYIRTDASLLGLRWPIELTLANRDTMGFRMLLGREAVRRRFIIDPGRSYFGGKRRREEAR